jgi:hypothetical protein
MKFKWMWAREREISKLLGTSFGLHLEFKMLTPCGQNQKETKVLELCPSINYKKNGRN